LASQQTILYMEVSQQAFDNQRILRTGFMVGELVSKEQEASHALSSTPCLGRLAALPRRTVAFGEECG